MTDQHIILGIRKLNVKFQAKRTQIEMEFRSMKNYDRETFLLDMQGVDWEMAASTACSDPNIWQITFTIYCIILGWACNIKRTERDYEACIFSLDVSQYHEIDTQERLGEEQGRKRPLNMA